LLVGRPSWCLLPAAVVGNEWNAIFQPAVGVQMFGVIRGVLRPKTQRKQELVWQNGKWLNKPPKFVRSRPVSFRPWRDAIRFHVFAIQSFDEEGDNEDMSFEGFTRPSE
jgi:hypothetical protein